MTRDPLTPEQADRVARVLPFVLALLIVCGLTLAVVEVLL